MITVCKLLQTLKSDLELEGVQECGWIVHNNDVRYIDKRHLFRKRPEKLNQNLNFKLSGEQTNQQTNSKQLSTRNHLS